MGIVALLVFLDAILPDRKIMADKGQTNNKIPTQQLLEDMLLRGKWVNKSDGYRLRETDSLTTTRYKYIRFKDDQTFSFDSVKQAYTGRWEINADRQVVMHFKDKAMGTRIASLNKKDQLVCQGFKYENHSSSWSGIINFFEFTSFANFTYKHGVMILVGLFFIFLAIRYNYEPLLLIPIGTGIIIGNIPFFQALGFNLQLGIYEEGSVLNYLYFGVVKGVYPPLIFLGIGAMTDFSSLISNPRLMLLGAAAQIGIFLTFLGALFLGFAPPEAGAIGIIGGADGPTAIFLSSKLANGLNILPNGETVKNLIGPIAIAAYSYMALVPVIQPPIMRLLTNRKERRIRMKPPRAVSRFEKIIFPIIGLLLTCFIAPSALPLLGMLFFGNLLKESGVTKRLADTARTSMIDIVTILLGLTVGASTQADVFLRSESILIFVLGALSFMIATAGGILFAKIMNVFLNKDNKINPLVGAAGVSAVPDSARVVQHEGLKEDPSNHLLMHAMAPNVSGVIGSAVAAGILLSFLM